MLACPIGRRRNLSKRVRLLCLKSLRRRGVRWNERRLLLQGRNGRVGVLRGCRDRGLRRKQLRREEGPASRPAHFLRKGTVRIGLWLVQAGLYFCVGPDGAVGWSGLRILFDEARNLGLCKSPPERLKLADEVLEPLDLNCGEGGARRVLVRHALFFLLF